MNETAPFAGRIGIVGAGALGAFYGARLARAGHNVHFLLRSDYDAVKANGLTVQSFEGDFHITPPVYASAEDLGICDLVIIGLKTTANAALPALLASTVGPHTIVLTLQNGLGNEDAIAAATGREHSNRILGGIALHCSNRTAPGVIHHMDNGWIRMGEFDAPVTERSHAIAALFTSAGIRCEVYPSLMQARWEKLVWNIPFNSLGVVARANVAEVLTQEHLHKLAHHLMLETCSAAAATGTQLDPVMPAKMLKNSESMGAYRSSMQVDFENGLPLEFESIVGEPLRRGQAGGAQLPHMETIYALLKQLSPRS